MLTRNYESFRNLLKGIMIEKMTSSLLTGNKTKQDIFLHKWLLVKAKGKLSLGAERPLNLHENASHSYFLRQIIAIFSHLPITLHIPSFLFYLISFLSYFICFCLFGCISSSVGLPYQTVHSFKKTWNWIISVSPATFLRPAMFCFSIAFVNFPTFKRCLLSHK